VRFRYFNDNTAICAIPRRIVKIKIGFFILKQKIFSKKLASKLAQAAKTSHFCSPFGKALFFYRNLLKGYRFLFRRK